MSDGPGLGPEGPADDERARWLSAVDAAEVGAFVWDLATGELHWDQKLLDHFGMTREMFGGTIEAFNDALHPDDLPRVGEALRTAIETCGSYAAEYRVILPDGSQRWIAARGRAIPDADGVAARLLGAAYDTTQVQHGEARVARVLEAMPSAFFHLSRDWRFTYLNSEAKQLLAGIERELEGGVIWELFPDALDSDFEIHYRHAMSSGNAVEFEAYYPPPLDRWYEVRGWPTPDGLSVYFVDITERRLALAEADRASARTAVLAGITDALVDTLDMLEAAQRLAREVAGHWADWSLVTLIDHSVAVADEALPDSGPAWRRGLHDVASWHRDEQIRDLVERYRQVRIPALTDLSFLARTLREARPIVVADDAARRIAEVFSPGVARDLCLELDASAAAILPLRARNRTVGILSVFRGPGRPTFTAEDVADLTDAASRAGLALDNLRLYAEQRALAEGLQRSLMTAPPQSKTLEIAVRYEPAAEVAQVGGDWYDAFRQPTGGVTLVIGDVVGHDTAAAAAMGQIRNVLRGIAVSSAEGPADVLRCVDTAMATLRLDSTATALVARVTHLPDDERSPAGDGPAGHTHGRPTTRLTWSNAGHPPPLLITGRGEATRTRVLDAEDAELLLGLDPSTERTETVLDLPPDATVLLYTDGLVERRGQPLESGIRRLAAVATELSVSGPSMDELAASLLEWMLPERPEDDVALVVVRVRGPQG